MPLNTFKPPKDDSRISWTQHAIGKMRHYGLSEQRIRRVLRNPKRKEEAVASGCVAVMQPTSPTAKHQTEIWVMYKLSHPPPLKAEEKEGGTKANSKLQNPNSNQSSKLKTPNSKIKIISVWRYPGISPEREPPPIPEDVLKEIHRML